MRRAAAAAAAVLAAYVLVLGPWPLTLVPVTAGAVLYLRRVAPEPDDRPEAGVVDLVAAVLLAVLAPVLALLGGAVLALLRGPRRLRTPPPPPLDPEPPTGPG